MWPSVPGLLCFPVPNTVAHITLYTCCGVGVDEGRLHGEQRLSDSEMRLCKGGEES